MIGHALMVGQQIGGKLLETGDTTGITLSSILTDSGSIFTAMMGWVGDVLETIGSNPLLLMFVIGTFALVAIGIVQRLLRL